MTDQPWLFRTYAGHSTAAESNRLFRTNLSRGQTGLSVAFDLPTQTGYDSDHPLARGEVGKVGVPISHLGDMQTLFEGIPLAAMNTSMTINATAPWLLALYVAAADTQGAARAQLQGTTQNDIIKEYLARGTYVFPPQASLRLTADTIAFATRELPKFNPVNVCSYHLQEAGATPVQELAFALATATAVLDAARAAPEISAEAFPQVASRISFFVNAGIRFVTEMCKMRAFVDLWDELLRARYGVSDAKLRRFRYGVQVNSLGLTEQQPENNVYRILIEMLGVVLSKKARARAVQLPAWNEALGLPRPFDQQWSLRMQQIMALETDLLDYGDLFDGSPVVDAKVEELKAAARSEQARLEALGGAAAPAAIAYMKEALVASNTARLRAIESGETKIVGVNIHTSGEPSPLAAGDAIMTVKDHVEDEQIARLRAWRATRDNTAVSAAIAELRRAAAEGRNIMEPSIACARAGVTTGEWADTLRQVFGEYRAPTGVSLSPAGNAGDISLEGLRTRVEALAQDIGSKPKFLVGKPGLDGHSNGAEQIATRAAETGLHVIYDGIRMTPEALVDKVSAEKVQALGLSILSGSHVPLVRDVMQKLRARNISVPVVVGGIIPEEDAHVLRQLGVAAVYTPKDFDLNAIMGEVIGLMEKARAS
ncbi:MAG: methylmalonyl-CoA mutase family protein [Proteobacteria bacterium]|nr:methylmalonyl-CoA mutase family protein [Pseudomonadota bacterium]